MSGTAGRLTREEARRRAALVDGVTYEVELDLTDPSASGFRSDTTIRFEAQPGASVHLDLTSEFVERVRVNGRDVDVDECVHDHRIELDDLAASNEVQVVARCVYQSNGVGMHRFHDPTDEATYVYTQFEPFDAHRVLACFDQPDLKAPLSLRVRAPRHWTVLANSPVVEAGDGVWRFARTPALSPYLYAVTGGAYEGVKDNHGATPLGLYARRSMREHVDVEELLELTRRGLDFFEEVFACPYPFDKYDQVFVPEFSFGAMENPGCVTFSETYLFRGRVTEAQRESRANTLYHEMAHMWFGDLVTMRWWGDLWLNESFATFMGYLACERASRFTRAWVTFADEERSWARRQDQLPTTHPIVADAGDVEEVMQNFDGITYAKGASVLRQLVAWVGEDAFLDGCRGYFAKHAWSNAELSDFLRELERASGRDLGPWSRRWLQTAGVNTLTVDSDVADGTYERATVVQQAAEQWPTLRPHRLDVALYDAHGEDLRLRTSVEMEITEARTALASLEDVRTADLVLPDHTGLTFAKLRLDERSVDTVVARLAGLEDGLARTQCWGAAWDMLRDGVMPAARYMDLVRGNVHGESEIGVLEAILGRLRVAVGYYGDPAKAADRFDELAADAREEVETAEPSSDEQLAWARHWISCARTGTHPKDARRLLDGELEVEGLEVDTELRWHIVGALAGVGTIGTDVIDDEQTRDPTDLGERRAAAAHAARPDADAKARAWERVVDDDSLSHSKRKAIMSGFRRRDQPDLLRPYREAYFTTLLDVFETRELEVALAFANRMYPTPLVDNDTIAATGRFLDDDVPRPLRRALLEQRDTVQRALRTRTLDAQQPGRD